MLKIINGTFENGCGVTIHDTETDNYYHKVVYKNSIEHNGKLYYKEDFKKQNILEIPKQYKHEYVSCLPIELESQIMEEVKKEIRTLFLTDEEKQEAIENANNEKVCNLTDTIKVKFV